MFRPRGGGGLLCDGGGRFIGLVWKIKLADTAMRAAAPIGAAYTAIALVTGAIWGKPTWGAWWVWDARITSMLILLFLYLGVIALFEAYENKAIAARACAVLSLVGTVNIPVIYKSVDWWYSLRSPRRLSLPARQRSTLDALSVAGHDHHVLCAVCGVDDDQPARLTAG